MLKAKLLSLIAPAYKQEKTIVKDIKNIDKILTSLFIKHESMAIKDIFLAIHIVLLVLLTALFTQEYFVA